MSRDVKLERAKVEIALAENLFNKAFSVSAIVIGATIATIHKEGVTLWGVLGIIGSYFSLVAMAIMLKRWKEKVNLLRELENGNDSS
jgi:hypothetical protein